MRKIMTNYEKYCKIMLNYENYEKSHKIMKNYEIMTTNKQEQVWNAVILRALNVVEKNISFNACDSDNNLYKCMFPDSKIAKNYQQGRGKIKYVIQFGISPYISKMVQKDLRNQPFTFHFDETTTSQVKKLYDGYATYYSPSEKKSPLRIVAPCTSENAVQMI